MTTQEYVHYNSACTVKHCCQNSKPKHEHVVSLFSVCTQKHRVVVPETKLSQERMSVAFFARPNFDCVIKCLDGSDKYEPITPFDQLSTHLLATGLAAHVQ